MTLLFLIRKFVISHFAAREEWNSHSRILRYIIQYFAKTLDKLVFLEQFANQFSICLFFFLEFIKSKEGITSDFQRVVRIYRPVKNAGQQYNQDAYGTWQVEFVNAGRAWNNPLMGWTSRKDSMYDEHFKWVHFDSKEDAIKWAIRAGNQLQTLLRFLW